MVQLERVGESHTVTVSGSLSKAHREIPPTACIGLASFAWRENEFRVPCLLDTGTTHLALGDIVRDIQSKGQFEHDMPLVMHTADYLVKGKIRIRIEPQHVQLGQVRIQDSVQINASLVGKSMLSYIQGTIQAGQQMQDTIRGTQNMRVPIDCSESGIEMTGNTPLPAAAYVMAETPRSNSRFWLNAYQTVMKRDGLRPEEWSRLNMEGKARTMALVASYLPQYLDYVSDTVVRNTGIQGYENFDDSLTTWSGDCEVRILLS
jgi:hypothetical protein